MLTTREAILALIETTYKGFKTVYKGYPLVINVGDVSDDGTRKGGIAIAPQSDDSMQISTGFDESFLAFRIELYLDATHEGETEDRGEANEVWITETMEGIRNLLFTEANWKIADNTTLEIKNQRNRITYGDREGEIRLAVFEVSYRKRRVRA